MSESNPNQLHTEIVKALTDRTIWEQRQRIWYQMRHDGLRRKNKPFEGAADMHFPMVDTTMEKMKPFYWNQITQTERLAEFQARADMPPDAASGASEWMDYQIKENTDFEGKALSVIDTMLLRGRGILKAYWNVEEGKICIKSIDPLYFIVPKQSGSLEEMDWFVEVQHYTIAKYKRDRRFVQDPEIIKQIAGRGRTTDGDQSAYEDEKSIREGLTFSSDSNVIVVWECYRKTVGGWTVYTYSPTNPSIALRKPYGAPYKWQGKPVLPYVTDYIMEIKDEGWFAPRGIAERLAPFEAYLCKIWNDKCDFLTFSGKPLFTRDQELSNTANIQFRPGEVLPKGVMPARMEQPPMALDQEMMMTRQVGEQSIQVPDFGIGEKNGSEPRSATEVNYIQALTSTGVDMKARIFRLALAKTYRLFWAILIQYKKDDAAYYIAKERKVLPQQAMVDNFRIQPSGNTDSWNKSARVQVAVGRFQLLKGHPNVNQEELVKDVIAADDPLLVKTLWVPTNVKAGTEMEDEALEIMLLEKGFPAQAKPEEDHVTRLKVLIGRLQQLDQMGQPLDPVAMQTFQQHVAQHIQMLQQMNPALAKQVQQQIQMMAQSGGQGNVVPMPSRPGPQMPVPPAPAVAPQSQPPAAAGGAI